MTYHPDESPAFDEPSFDPEPDDGPEDSGYAPDDPKHPDWHSVHADLWDLREKGC